MRHTKRAIFIFPRQTIIYQYLIMFETKQKEKYKIYEVLINIISQETFTLGVIRDE